jgi:hypothetical protein
MAMELLSNCDKNKISEYGYIQSYIDFYHILEGSSIMTQNYEQIEMKKSRITLEDRLGEIKDILQ